WPYYDTPLRHIPVFDVLIFSSRPENLQFCTRYHADLHCSACMRRMCSVRRRGGAPRTSDRGGRAPFTHHSSQPHVGLILLPYAGASAPAARESVAATGCTPLLGWPGARIGGTVYATRAAPGRPRRDGGAASHPTLRPLSHHVDAGGTRD